MVALVVAVTLLVAAVGGVFLVPAVLALTPERGQMRLQAAALLRGGLVIGVLERLAVAGCVLLGHPEGVAVVVAVKGLGRYPEIKGASGPTTSTGPAAAAAPTAAPNPTTADPVATDPAQPSEAAPSPVVAPATALGAAVSERFIIGTLASYVWAVACAAAGVWWLTALG